MRKVYIVNALRTAIGSFNGTLAKISASDLAVPVLNALVEQTGIKKENLDGVILGNVLQAGQGQNPARQTAIKAGLPAEKTAHTLNMVCGSGLKTVVAAAQEIMLGDSEMLIAGGAENMNQAPYILKQARTGYRMGDGQLIDTMVFDGLTDIFNQYHMGITAENLAEKYNISREEQDTFACGSQNKTGKAMNGGKFENEIIPVLIPQRKKDPIEFKTDEFPRAGVTVESLGKLRPAFKKDGTVTAANASGINDGAALVLVASEEAVKKHNLTPMAEIVSYAEHGCDPSIMGIGPVEAVKKALVKADWKVEDLELIEANEAFAAQSLSVEKELGWNSEIVNVNGGAIALGHPIGASGARILVTLLHEMKRRKVEKGLATLCIGGGMGIAMCVKSL